MTCPTEAHSWLDNASKIATIVIATFVAFIGAFQWFTAREKLRLDLYDRRFEVYSRTVDLIQATMEWSSRDPLMRLEIHRLFIKAALESRFLFANDPSIAALLDEMNKNTFIIKGFVEYIAPQAQSMGSLYLDEYEKKQGALEAIMNSIVPLQQKLAPYLAFGQKQFEPLLWRTINLRSEG
jgi:hypothetical protein